MELILYAAAVVALFLGVGIAVWRINKSKSSQQVVKIPFDYYKSHEDRRR